MDVFLHGGASIKRRLKRPVNRDREFGGSVPKKPALARGADPRQLARTGDAPISAHLGDRHAHSRRNHHAAARPKAEAQRTIAVVAAAVPPAAVHSALQVAAHAVLSFLVIAASASLLIPRASRQHRRQGLRGAAPRPVGSYGWILLVIGVVMAVASAARFYFSRSWVTRHLDLRGQVFDHLPHSRPNYFDCTGSAS